MSDTKQITKALIQAQKEIKGVSRNKKNEHFNYSYADLSSVIESSQSILNNLNIFVNQGFDYDAENHVFYVDTILMHDSGESISTQIGFPITKKDPQSIGSLCTYGRRYSLCAMLGIPVYDDDGHGAVAWRTDSQIKEFSELIKHKSFDGMRNETKKWWKDKRTEEESSHALDKMRAKVSQYDLDEQMKNKIESEVE